jgi:enterochelin esterase family protein
MPGKVRIPLALTAVALGFSHAAMAQAPPAAGGQGAGRGPQDTLVSPEVHPDRTVTFRIRAPQASGVKLTGDWLATPDAPTGGIVSMTKDATGVWSVTSAPLEATVHLYSFTVDGLNIADPVNPKLKLRTRTSASLVEVPGDPAPAWQIQDVPHGSVDWNWQHSAAYDDTHEFFVYLPPGYEKGNTRYPVLYLVHGAGDTAAAWTMAGAANVILDNLIAQKKAAPMIVVMPFNGGTPAARLADQPPPAASAAGRGNLNANPAFEEYMLKELMPFIDAKYRTAPGRKNRAMAGLSAGGAATYNVGLKHLEIFSQLGMFSAAGGGGGDFAKKYPPLASDPKGTNTRLTVFWIGCGREDPLDAAAKAFDASLTKLQIKHTFMDREGGHVWPVWRWCLTQFAPLLFK